MIALLSDVMSYLKVMFSTDGYAFPETFYLGMCSITSLENFHFTSIFDLSWLVLGPFKMI